MNLTSILAWTLLHFIWQGTIVVVILSLVLAASSRRSPLFRYQTSVVALLVMVALPIATALRMARVPSSTVAAGRVAAVEGGPRSAASGGAPATESPGSRRSAPRASSPGSPRWSGDQNTGWYWQFRLWADASAPLLVAGWLAGVLLLSVRFGGGWIRVRHLTRTAVRTASLAHAEQLARLAGRLGVTRTVQLLESALVKVPTVIGWLRPVLLMPLSLNSGLTPRDIELLFAHELAHIKRHDYLVNLLQTVVETVLFYHPGVWWISAQIREEREHCCDDIAVALCDDKRIYAEALLRLEELRRSEPRLAVAANGGNLLRRIRRLLASSGPHSESRTRWVAIPVGLVALITVAGGAMVRDASAPLLSADELPQNLTLRADTLRAHASRNAPPDSVVMYDGAATSLDTRWAWAESAAKRAPAIGFWIGYVIDGDAARGWSYIDRRVPVYSGNSTMTGSLHMKQAPEGLTFLGVRLDSLVGSGSPEDQLILFGFVRRNGRMELDRVHASPFMFPAYFSGRRLFWLGHAKDEESIAQVQRLFVSTPGVEHRRDLVNVVGLHLSEPAVLRTLTAWLETSESQEVRSEVADQLGVLSSPAALELASRVARHDRSRDVRREATEAIGEMSLSQSVDTLIAIARDVGDREVRREAVETLGERTEARAFDAVIRFVWEDPDVEVAQEAVETLGESHNARAALELERIARTHPLTALRREAIETLGQLDEPDVVLPILRRTVEQDASSDVRQGAVETLGELKTRESLAALTEYARTSDDPDVRHKALEVLADQGEKGQVIEVLKSVIDGAADEKDQEAAVEHLADIEDRGVVAMLEKIAANHPRSAVRRAGIQALANVQDRGTALDAVNRIIWQGSDPTIQLEGVSALGEIEAPGLVTRLETIANDHPGLEVRRAAVEKLGDLEHNASALTVLARIAKSRGDESLRKAAIEAYVNAGSQEEILTFLRDLVSSSTSYAIQVRALEALVDLDRTAGVPTIVEVAQSHPNRDLRRRAVEMLGDSDDPRAHAALARLLERKQ